VKKVESRYEGGLDLRGFLGVSEEVPVGCQNIRVYFKIDANVSEAQKEELIRMAQKYSPVFNTITKSAPVSVHLDKVEGGGILSEIRTHFFGHFLRWFNNKTIQEDGGGIPGVAHRVRLHAGSGDDLNPRPKIFEFSAERSRINGKIVTGKSLIVIGSEDP
jgi:hypothetical protein